MKNTGKSSVVVWKFCPREFPRANFPRQPLLTFHCLYQPKVCLPCPWPAVWPRHPGRWRSLSGLRQTAQIWWWWCYLWWCFGDSYEYDITDNNSVYYDDDEDDDDGEDEDNEESNSWPTSSPFLSVCSTRGPAVRVNLNRNRSRNLNWKQWNHSYKKELEIKKN